MAKNKAKPKKSYYDFDSKIHKHKESGCHVVRDGDIFGFPIRLSFDGKGNEHKTVIGGVMSIFVKIFLAWYFFS